MTTKKICDSDQNNLIMNLAVLTLKSRNADHQSDISVLERVALKRSFYYCPISLTVNFTLQ